MRKLAIYPLVVISGLVAAGCASKASATPFPMPPTPSATPPSATPSSPVLPSVGQVLFPYETADAGNFIVLPGSIHLEWETAPSGADRYEFAFMKEGTTTVSFIAEDVDSSDGVTAEWDVPSGLNATLRAFAHFKDGSVVPSYPSGLVHVVQGPPPGICTIARASTEKDIFRTPSSATEPFAYLDPLQFAHVLAKGEHGWYLIDTWGAFDKTTGARVTGTGWVDLSPGTRLYGSCEYLPPAP